jgi:hypothetical protein
VLARHPPNATLVPPTRGRVNVKPHVLPPQLPASAFRLLAGCTVNNLDFGGAGWGGKVASACGAPGAGRCVSASWTDTDATWGLAAGASSVDSSSINGNVECDHL